MIDLLAYKALTTAVHYSFREFKTKFVFNEKGAKLEMETKLFGLQDVKKEIDLAVPEAIRSRMSAPMLERCQKLLPSFFGKPEKQLEEEKKQAEQTQGAGAKQDTPEQTREKFRRYASHEAHDLRHGLSEDFYAASRVVSASRSLPDGDAKQQAAKLGERLEQSRQSTEAMLNLRSQYGIGEGGRSMRDLDPQQRQAFREAYVKAVEDRMAVSNVAKQYQKEFGAPAIDDRPPPGGPGTKAAQAEAERTAGADARARRDAPVEAPPRQSPPERQAEASVRTEAPRENERVRGAEREARERDAPERAAADVRQAAESPARSRFAEFVPPSRQSELARPDAPQRQESQAAQAPRQSALDTFAQATHEARSQESGRQASQAAQSSTAREAEAGQRAPSRFAEFVPPSRQSELARPDAPQRQESQAAQPQRQSALDTFAQSTREARSHEAGREGSQAARQAAGREAEAGQRAPSRFDEFVPPSRRDELTRPSDAAHREDGARNAQATASLDDRIAARARGDQAGAHDSNRPLAEQGEARMSNLEKFERGTEHARAGQQQAQGRQEPPSREPEREPAPTSSAPQPRLTPENEDWYKKAIAEGERDLAASRELSSDARAGEREQARTQHDRALQSARADFDSPDRERATSAASIVQAQSDFRRADDRLGELMQRHGVQSADDVSKLRQLDQHEFARAHLNAEQARDRVAELGQRHEREFGQGRAESNVAAPQRQEAGKQERQERQDGRQDGASRPNSLGEQFLREEQERQQRRQEDRARQSAQSEDAKGRTR